MTTKNATKTQAKIVFQSLKDAHDLPRDSATRGPILDLLGMEVREAPRIVWEEGPFDWAIQFAGEQWTVEPGTTRWGDVWVEPINGYSLHVFREVEP